MNKRTWIGVVGLPVIGGLLLWLMLEFGVEQQVFYYLLGFGVGNIAGVIVDEIKS